MKILLVQSYLGRKEKTGPIFPLGLAYLAAVLKKHHVKVIDLNIEAEPYNRLKEEVSVFNPDVVGISLRNVDTTLRRDIFYYFKELKPTAELIKKTKPTVKLLIGGPGFSMFTSRIMERVPEIDIGVFLEGEESVLELLENLDDPEKVKGLYIRKNNSAHFTGQRKLPEFNKLPFPDRNIVPIEPYLGPYNNIGVQTKRGCLLKCVYCTYPFLSGKILRQRSPENVVDEVEHLVNNFNIRNFMFVDSVFNIPKEHAQEICQEVINRGLDVEWNAYFDPKNVDEDFVLLAKKAGCRHFMLSPDAITEKGLVYLRKNFTLKDVYKTLAIAKRMKGVRFGYGVFCNFPGQDLAGYLKTILFYIKGNLFLMGKGGVDLNWIRIEPNTEIHKNAIEKGIIDHDMDLLPEDKIELRSVFYNPPPLRYIDPFVSLMLNVVDKLLKPSLKYILR